MCKLIEQLLSTLSVPSQAPSLGGKCFMTMGSVTYSYSCPAFQCLMMSCSLSKFFYGVIPKFVKNTVSGLRITIMRIRFRLFTLKRIRIRILFLIKVLRICNYWSTDRASRPPLLASTAL